MKRIVILLCLLSLASCQSNEVDEPKLKKFKQKEEPTEICKKLDTVEDYRDKTKVTYWEIYSCKRKG